MSEEQTDSLSLVTFTFEYTGHGWAYAAISDGVTTHDMSPSYVPQDPLWALVAAIDKVLAYGGDAECTWNYEPEADRWLLRRDGETLHITIRGVSDGFSRLNWPTDRGDLYFSATCELWKFAAKLRTVVSRVKPLTEEYHDPARVQGTPEYRALCAYLEEHKRSQRQP